MAESGDEVSDMNMDDSELEKILLQHSRPVRPGSLEDARQQVEALLVPGLVRGGISEPEARVEATRVLGRFERLAYQRGREDGQRQADLGGAE